MSVRKELPEVQAKTGSLLAGQYEFDTLIMAAILAAPDDQTSLFLITHFRPQADQLVATVTKVYPQPGKATGAK